jgi:hypothetical protein
MHVCSPLSSSLNIFLSTSGCSKMEQALLVASIEIIMVEVSWGSKMIRWYILPLFFFIVTIDFLVMFYRSFYLKYVFKYVILYIVFKFYLIIK